MRNRQPQPSLPPISRRALLGIGAAGLVAGSVALSGQRPAQATSEGTVLPLVTPLPAGAPDRTLFAPNEQVLGSYLMILAPLANSVVDDDPELFGWMEDGWWRTPNDPINSRIMEHVATLAWFLTHERTWNPYYLDANLEARLDAALGYYLSLQGPRGAWPVTYESESLATTGFGLVSLSHTCRDLASLDLLPARRGEMATAMRAAAAWLMNTSYAPWNLPIQVHNQLAGGLAGVGHAATVLEDPSISTDLADRIAYFIEHSQAPAGYFHEPLGFDFGYNSSVALPDLGDLYTQTQNPLIVEHVRRWADFAQYVLLPEPNSSGFTIMSQACLRNAANVHAVRPDDDLDRAALARVFVDEVPLLAPLHSPAEHKITARAAWSGDPTAVEPRAKGDTSPRLYDHVPKAPDNVDAAARDAVLAGWRPVAESAFTEHREGTIDQQLLFVRRPGYYLASLAGVRGGDRARSGPGLFWHPVAGSMIASFNGLADDHWSTVVDGGYDVGLTNQPVTYHDGLDGNAPVIPAADLSAHTGAFTARYVGGAGTVTTDVTHLGDGVVRTVSAGGSAVEMVPLLVREGDAFAFSDGTTAGLEDTVSTTATWFAVTRGSIRLQVAWDHELEVSVTATGRRYFPERTHTHAIL
ncbi:hypothetical protein, partial [Pseudactinotalea sp.]|uniref:hypothetical protein n=1 Tax=Pseudactinotalea sp. TaxID=1926260 RepID=UPI003B3B4C90